LFPDEIAMKRTRLPFQRLKRLKVGLVYLFGSQALGIQAPLSDVDIGIVFFDRGILDDFRMRRRTYTELYNIFSEIFPPTFERELDIVFLQQTSVNFQYDVIVEGKVLYEKTPVFRAN
jgi:predicted nucleotidyltransferase